MSSSSPIWRLRSSARKLVSAHDLAPGWRRPFANFSKEKRRLDGLSEVLDWRLHDLRRTMISGMARLGVAPHIADKILNHASGTISGVAAVYQRHEFMRNVRTLSSAGAPM